MAIKIEQAESCLAQRLSTPITDSLRDLNYSTPEQYRLRISLLDAKGKKKRRSASADNWSPESGRIEISFEPKQAGRNLSSTIPVTAKTSAAGASILSGAVQSPSYLHPAECDLIHALNRAESRPGWSFVPLKKFRDEILASEYLPSMRTDIERQSVLRSAIEKRLVLVGKVSNPRAPEFPVTTIRLNRLLPEVQQVIGDSGRTDSDFHPVEIPGEPLSTTILRERR